MKQHRKLSRNNEKFSFFGNNLGAGELVSARVVLIVDNIRSFDIRARSRMKAAHRQGGWAHVRLPLDVTRDGTDECAGGFSEPET